MLSTPKEKANEFAAHLKEKGLKAELKEAKGNPSVVVDLTASTWKQ